MVSTTGFISFETNRYSVPYSWSARACSVQVYPQYLEMLIAGKKVAAHKRSFLDTVTASAILDRLSLNGRFITFEGRSYRSKK
jgi:hypothetical protein